MSLYPLSKTPTLAALFLLQSKLFFQDVDSHGGGATRSSLRTTGEPLPIR